MLIKRGQLPILIVNVLYLLASLFLFLGRKNYEFVMYIGVIVLVFILIVSTNEKINYPNSVLWGLTIWGMMHMLGGGLIFKNGFCLYKLMLYEFSSVYPILRYDQFVHLFGFAVATLLMFVVIKPKLKMPIKRWWAISIVVVMAGLGVGALNEIIGFFAVVIMPETGVGGFMNMALDLVADFIGAVLAMVLIYVRKGNL